MWETGKKLDVWGIYNYHVIDFWVAKTKRTFIWKYFYHYLFIMTSQVDQSQDWLTNLFAFFLSFFLIFVLFCFFICIAKFIVFSSVLKAVSKHKNVQEFWKLIHLTMSCWWWLLRSCWSSWCWLKLLLKE